MKRYALYARYSSEHQNERSIDDQVTLCRAEIERRGGTLSEIYADYAISGSHMRSRPRMLQLMDDARDGRFDVVIAEALDRLSRDQEDIAAIHKRLRFAGVRILTLGEGEIDELHIGLKGTMNALFLKDLAAKVRRGQKGTVQRGRAAGGLSYGYRVVREFDDRGEMIRGGREIDPDQAAVVRRIFEAMGAGRSARSVATELNRAGIPSPAGGSWSASTINGNRARRSGLLFNDLYVGRIVYNRVRMIRDPESGKRISRPNPESEWVIQEAPELRIVSDELWAAVQRHKQDSDHLAVHRRRRPRRLLSGLVYCGVCGASYTVKSKDWLACTAQREKGTCTNNRTVRVEALEKRILAGIEQRMLAPEVVAAFVAEYRGERERLAGDRRRRLKLAETRIGELGRGIERILDMIVDGHAGGQAQAGALATRLEAMEREKVALQRERAVIEADNQVVDLHPAIAEIYRKHMDDFTAAMAAADETARAEAAAPIRALISRIEIHPLPGRGQVDVILEGLLPALTQFARPKPGEHRQSGTVLMVAREGLEPPTRGL
jgi:site-specific DNA recombinase